MAERWAQAVEAAEESSAMPDGSPLEAWVATVRAMLCRQGVEQMRADAEAARSALAPASPWRPASVLLQGVAVMLAGEPDHAETILSEAAEVAVGNGAVWVGLVARSELTLLALERGDLPAAAAELSLGGSLVDNVTSADYVVPAIFHAATARLALAQGKGTLARQALASAQRLRPMLTHALSWFSVQARLELAKAHLALADPRGAAVLHREAERDPPSASQAGHARSGGRGDRSSGHDHAGGVVGVGVDADRR